jgi:hypothetical protein
MKKILLITGSLIALGLGGCTPDTGADTGSSSDLNNSSGIYDSAIQSQVQQSLTQSANEASNALQTLAMVKSSQIPPADPALDESHLPLELQRPTTINWTGPSVPLIKQLAQNVGYNFVTTGQSPAHDVMVNVSLNGVSAARAFQDVGLQMEQYGTIVLNPNTKTVELRYSTSGGQNYTEGYQNNNLRHLPKMNSVNLKNGS